MENQPISNPQDPNNQPLSPQQPTDINPVQQPAGPQQITPTAVEPPAATFSSPQVITAQPTVFTAAPQPHSTYNPITAATPKRSSSLKFTVIAILALVALAAGSYVLISSKNKAANPTSDTTTASNQSSADTSNATASGLTGEKPVAFGTSVTDGTFKVTLLGVTDSPTVTGDQPDAGTKYLEADFSVTSNPNKDNYAFNMLFAPSTVPPGGKLGDIELSPVDSLSGTTSPITFNNIPAKTVEINGKNSAEGYTIPSDGSVKTVTVYTLFEIKPNDQGHIVWQGLDGNVYHFLTK